MIRIITTIVIFFVSATVACAQKPFNEGVIVYDVKLTTPDQKAFTGTYTYTMKGNQLRKELHLSNGYEDIILISGSDNSSYSLNTINGAKYAIQLNMADMQRRQEKYKGFYTMGEEGGKTVGGQKAFKAKVKYKDGSDGDVFYSKDWYATLPSTFERFPDAKFLPLSYSYTDDKGLKMEFDAKSVEARPVENSIFRIPAGYKMISYQEYQQMGR